MKHLIFFTLVLLIAACSKDFGDLGENKKLEGVALKTDPFSQSGDSVPLKAATVKIRVKGNANSFLYSTTTDDDGRFAFSNLKEKTDYEIFHESIISSVPFAGYVALNTENEKDNKLVIAPDSTKINITVARVTDQFNSPFNNVKIYRFINKTYFDNSYTAGAIDSFLTDSRGIYTYYQSPPGKYYFLVKVVVNSITLTGRKEQDVPLYGVSRPVIQAQ